MSVHVEEQKDGVLFHFHLSDNTPSEEAMLGETPVIWKDVLVEGDYPMSPVAGVAVAEPMRVVPEGESNYKTRTISMSDLIDAHEDKAFKYVTIPTRHEDKLLDNTGYIPRPGGVRVVKKFFNDDGDVVKLADDATAPEKGIEKHVLQAALGFTEPDIKGKVERGTIPDVSAGIFFNWLNKHTKKTYRAAMKHAALTGVPFMGNLTPFKPIFASDEEIGEDTKIEFYQFAETPSTEDNTDTGEIVWNEQEGFSWQRDEIDAALNPTRDDESTPSAGPRAYYWVQDVTGAHALVNERVGGKSTRFVIPYTREDGAISIAPATRWVEAREAMIAASDQHTDFEELSVEKLREKLGIALSEQFGKEQSDYFRIADVTLDNRVMFVNKVDSARHIARFSFDDGDVRIAPVGSWEAVQASAKPDEEKSKQQATPDSNVVHMSDKLGETPEGRVRAARMARRKLMRASAN